MRYGFVARMSAQYAVERLCQTLSVSRSGYYAWKKRKPSQRVLDNQLLTEHMQRIHQHSRGTYGSPRLQAALRKAGWRVNHKRVARLMRLAGLVGRRKVRRVSTTHSRHPYPVAPNRLGQEFSAQAPNQKWVGDITYIPTAEGWLYLAGILDLYSRKIVGWEMGSEITADLVERALRMALFQRHPLGRELLHHSDRGSQYASEQIQTLLAAHHIQVSMSRTGNCYDNAVMESFFATLKCEWVHFQRYTNREEARRDIFGYIEGFYNTHRLHSSLGYLSPNEFEARSHPSP
jgi:putative transposase